MWTRGQGRSQEDEEYYIRVAGTFLVIANHGMCAIALLFNALNLICGNIMASEAQRLWDVTRPRVRKMGDLTQLLYGLKNVTVNYPKVRVAPSPKKRYG